MNHKTFTVMLILASAAVTANATHRNLQDPPATPQTPQVAPAPKAQERTRTEQRERIRVAAAPSMYMRTGGGSYLGVDIAEVTTAQVTELKLKEERGVVLVKVDQDAPAGKAGLKEKDVVLDFNGTRVEGEEQLRRLLRETPAGRTITLGISRDGMPQQVKVTLGDRAKLMKDVKVWSGPGGMMAPMPPMPPMEMEMPAFEVITRSYSPSIGIMVDNLTPQLGEFFGVKAGAGVLVRSVEKGSVAEQAGFKAGDVIVKVDDEPIKHRNDWRRATRKKGGKLNINFVREKREQSLPLNIPERKPADASMLFAPDMEDFELDLDLAPGIEVPEFDLRLDINTVEAAQKALRLNAEVIRKQLSGAKMDEFRKQAREIAESVKKAMDAARSSDTI